MVKSVETEEPSKYYDEREFVKQEINPLLTEIYRKCSERNIPCIFLVESRNDEEYITESSGAVLPENRQSPRMKVLMTLLRDEGLVAKMAGLALLATALGKDEGPDASQSSEPSKREPLQ